MMFPIMASISRKLSNKVPISIFQMLLAGRHTHENRAFFMGSRGLYGFGLWEVKMLWVRFMGVTVVLLCSRSHPPSFVSSSFTFIIGTLL
jgi:hypothetical protein